MILRMYKIKLFLLLFCTLSIAKGTLYDPLHILEKSDAFLKVPPFESGFRVGQYAYYVTREITSSSEAQTLKTESFEVTEVSEDKVKYIEKSWWKNNLQPQQWDSSIDKEHYDKYKGNQLREDVEAFLNWGDSVSIESAVSVTVKVGKEKIRGIEVRFKDITPESPAGYALFRYILIPKHYFAQFALREVYVPFPGYNPVRKQLEKYVQ